MKSRKFRIRPGQKTTRLGTNLDFKVVPNRYYDHEHFNQMFIHTVVDYQYVIHKAILGEYWSVFRFHADDNLWREAPYIGIQQINQICGDEWDNWTDPCDAAQALEKHLTEQVQKEKITLNVLRIMADTLTCTVSRNHVSHDVWIRGSKTNLTRLARAISRQFKFDPKIKMGEKIDGKHQPGYPRIEFHCSTFY